MYLVGRVLGCLSGDGGRIQGHYQLHGEFKASRSYMRPHLFYIIFYLYEVNERGLSSMVGT